MAKKGKESTTTALYNLAKKKELAQKTGSGKAAADKAARQAPIAEMNRRSAQIKADIKKRTDSTKAKASKPDTSKRQQAAYVPTNKQLAVNAAKGSKRSPKARSSKQRAFLAIKYKKK
jgi:hypothetical protein